MIRKRIPRQDDKAILGLVQTLLVPFARITQPGLRLDLKSMRRRLKSCVSFVALGAGHQPCGFISIQSGPSGMIIDMLAVDPRVQGKGVGSRLLIHAERLALKAGNSEIWLWVDEANLKAQRFYATRNYEPFHYDVSLRCYLLRKLLIGDLF